MPIVLRFLGLRWQRRLWLLYASNMRLIGHSTSALTVLVMRLGCCRGARVDRTMMTLGLKLACVLRRVSVLLTSLGRLITGLDSVVL